MLRATQQGLAALGKKRPKDLKKKKCLRNITNVSLQHVIVILEQ